MAQAGITHIFVNLGSDHPSIMEAMVKGQNEKQDKFPRIITCPNEVRIQPPVKEDEQGRNRVANKYIQLLRWWLCPWQMAWHG